MPVHFAHGKITAEVGSRPQALACAAAILTLLVAAPALAQTTRYWAPDAGAGGSGTWNDTDLFWAPNADGSGTKVALDSTLTDNQASFGGTTGSNGAGSVDFTISGSTLRPYSGNVAFGSATAGSNFDITLSGTAGTISGLAASGTLSVATPLTGSSGVTASGSGTTVLTGANDHTGPTTLAGGTLTAGSAAALGSGGTISFTGGTLGYGSGVTTDFSGRFATGAGQAYAVDTGGVQKPGCG